MARIVLGGDLNPFNNETVGQFVHDMARQFAMNQQIPINIEEENPEFDDDESDSIILENDSIKNTDYDIVKKKYLYKNLTAKNQEISKTDDENLVVVKKKNTRKNRKRKLLSVSDENDCSTPRIPIEIISLILDRVDGETLLNCYHVSDTWRSIISSSTNSGSKRWMNVCIKEIPEEQFYDFLGNHEPKYWMEEVPILDFFYIYNKWSHWCKFIEMNKKLKTLCTIQTMITCIKTSGDWILISSGDGAIYAYSFSNHTLTPPILYGGDLQSMHLRCNKLPGNQASKLPGIGHDELIVNVSHPKLTRLNLHDFKVTYQDKVTHVNQLIPWFALLMTRFQTTGAFENVEINLTIRNNSTIFKATFMNGKIVVKKFGAIWSLINVWNGYVIAFCYDSYKMMIMDYDFNEIKHPFNNKCLLEKGVYPSYFFGLNTFVAVASSPNCPIPLQVHHLNYEKIYTNNIMPLITCVRFYGSHLFLGTAHGTIMVYRIEKIMDLLNLEHLESDRREIIHVCSQGYPIVAIDVHESQNKSSLIVATVGNILEISF